MNWIEGGVAIYQAGQDGGWAEQLAAAAAAAGGPGHEGHAHHHTNRTAPHTVRGGQPFSLTFFYISIFSPWGRYSEQFYGDQYEIF